MKITRRAVLHLTGLTAASLALTGCRILRCLFRFFFRSRLRGCRLFRRPCP